MDDFMSRKSSVIDIGGMGSFGGGGKDLSDKLNRVSQQLEDFKASYFKKIKEIDN